MTERSVSHATFVLERRYEADPKRVFAAWAEPAAKRRWFGDDEDSETLEYSLDFRVGGTEVWEGGPKDGPTFRNDTVYHDILPDQRIVFSYAMKMDEARISVSLATVELKAEGGGTRLVFTEQGAFLDGKDIAERRQSGWGSLLDALGKALGQTARQTAGQTAAAESRS